VFLAFRRPFISKIETATLDWIGDLAIGGVIWQLKSRFTLGGSSHIPIKGPANIKPRELQVTWDEWTKPYTPIPEQASPQD
jgi:hypothetical protein